MVKKSILFTILVAHLGIVIYSWWSGNSSNIATGEAANIWISIGRIMGLLLVTAVLNQMLMISRIPLIEQTFGHDKLSRVHHWTGYGITVFLIGHVLSILIGYGLMSGNSIVSQFLSYFKYGEFVYAIVAFVLLLSVLIISVIIVVSKMKYEWWYFPHLLTYGAVLFAYGHQIKFGSDLQQNFFGAYWITMYAVVATLVGWNRFAKPVFRYFRQKFRVDVLQPENDLVLSVYIKGDRLQELNVHAGQFFIFRFLTKGLWWQAHPFSLSYAPHTDRLRISAKAVGDFTTLLRDMLKPGVPVVVEGPFGLFGRQAEFDNKVLLIAGGIGITPIRSLFETLKNKDVVLLYAAKMENDFVLKKEIDEIAQRNNTKVLYITGKPDKEEITSFVPDARERGWYVCGPISMMKALRQTAKELGTPDKNFHWERFKL